MDQKTAKKIVLIAGVVLLVAFLMDRVKPSTGPVAVLIMEETAERPLLPESQLQILNSTELREWLETRCDKDDDGMQFRVVDKDADTQFMSKLWQERVAEAKSKPMPYLAVSNGKGGAEGDLPLSVDEVKAVVERYSGK